MKLRGMILALSIALTVLLLPQAAYATTAYYLTAPNAGLGGLSSSYQTPFGTVTVTLNSSTTATIGFSASSDYCIVGNNKGSGNKGAFGVNINASSFAYANLTYGPSAGANSVNWLGTSQMDGFGDFNAVFDASQFAGGKKLLQNLSFNVTNLSGTWADSAHVLTANSSKMFTTAHIAVLRSKNFGLTGFAGDSGPVNPPAQAPVPSTVILLGSGLLALGMRWHLRKR